MIKKIILPLLCLTVLAFSTIEANADKMTDFSLSVVKSDVQSEVDQALAQAELRADLTAIYNSDDVKPKVDEMLLNVLKSLADSDIIAIKAAAIAQDTPLSLEDAHILVEYTENFGIPNSLVLALIQTESDFNKYLVDSANDRGYMQIIPSTEKWLAEEYGPTIGIQYDPSRIYQAEYQFGLGTSYLKVLFDKHGQDFHKILSEYNRGPYNLKTYYNNYGTYHTNYSEKVVKRIANYQHLD